MFRTTNGAGHHQGKMLLGVTATRHVGDYLLTAHFSPADGKFLPELLISKPGGITLHRQSISGVAFTDRKRRVRLRQTLVGYMLRVEQRLGERSLATHALTIAPSSVGYSAHGACGIGVFAT